MKPKQSQSISSQSICVGTDDMGGDENGCCMFGLVLVEVRKLGRQGEMVKPTSLGGRGGDGEDEGDGEELQEAEQLLQLFLGMIEADLCTSSKHMD